MDLIPMPTVVVHQILTREKFIWSHNAYDKWFLIIPIYGSFTCTMNGRTWKISEGDLCFFPPNVIFERNIIETMQFHYIQLQWNCSDEELKKVNLYPLGKVISTDTTRMANTLSYLKRLPNALNSYRNNIITHFVCDIWVQLLLERYETFSMPNAHTSDPIMQEAIEYMKSHVSEPTSISEIAAQYNMTHVQFTRKFTKVFGLSPVKYMTELRIEKAKKLITETNLMLNQISTLCGYESPFYFSKKFSSLVGMSPTSYRENLKNL